MKKILTFASIALLSISAHAELVQQFKDPTFSGQGWASQVLTVEQMRNSASSSVASKAASDAAAAAAAAQNTPLAKFMSLFTGQVYSQLATQLTNNLFKECTGTACASGDFMVTSTQQIKWEKVTDLVTGVTNVTLKVYDGSIVNNSFVRNTAPTQTISVPVTQFQF